jgi:hypothetical protein
MGWQGRARTSTLQACSQGKPIVDLLCACHHYLGVCMKQPVPLFSLPRYLGLALASALLASSVSWAAAQASGTADADGARCILAGRLDTNQRWAPQARGIELLDSNGKRVLTSDKSALGTVKQVRISSPALLSQCNGNQALAKGDDLARIAKGTVPAVSANAEPVTVQAVAFPPLKVGGDLVELRLDVQPQRVVNLTR